MYLNINDLKYALGMELKCRLATSAKIQGLGYIFCFAEDKRHFVIESLDHYCVYHYLTKGMNF